MAEIGSNSANPVRSMPRFDSLYLAIWCVWLGSFALSGSYFASSFGEIPRYLRLLCCLLLVISEIAKRERYEYPDLLWFGVFALIALSAFSVKNTTLLQGFMFIYCGRNVDFRKVAVLTITVLAFVLFISATFSLLYDSSVGSYRIRNTLGFEWPSRPSNYLLNIVTLYIVIKEERCSNISLLLLAFLGLIFFIATDCRSPFLLLELSILGALLLKRNPQLLDNRAVRAIAPFSFWICALVILALALFYDSSNPVFQLLNRLLSNRLNYMHASMISGNFTLFGSPLYSVDRDVVDNAIGYNDSSYLDVLFCYGLIPFAILFSAYTALAVWAVRNRKDYLLLILIIVAIHGIPEWELSRVGYTTVMALFPTAIDGRFHQY